MQKRFLLQNCGLIQKGYSEYWKKSLSKPPPIKQLLGDLEGAYS